MKLGVIMAVEAEASAILGDAGFGWAPGPRGRLESADGRLALLMSGVGKVYAARAAAVLAADCGLLCALGTAGGLGSDPVGSLFLCGRFVEHDMEVGELGFPRGVTPYGSLPGPVFGSLGGGTAALLRRALDAAGLDARDGVCASGDRFVADRREADELRGEFGAVVSDMESAAAAKAALADGREFFALRWVSDNADHDSATDWPANVRRSAETLRIFLRALSGLLPAD